MAGGQQAEKYIIAPDSFKGTLHSEEICQILAQVIRKHKPCAEIVSVPIADGGEGTVDALLSAVGGRKVSLPVKGPLMETVDGFYGILPDGKTAVIEMAACAGLPLVGRRKAVERTTTYGVGQLMRDAVDRGCTKLIIGLGGSATNDMGAGAAAAMGARFLDVEGTSFVPVGETLAKVCQIDTSALRHSLAGVEIIAMCDIDNPLYGENGAAYVFAPQKGANADMVALLDDGLRALSAIVTRELDIDVAALPGAGAAGGMGGGLVAFFVAQMKKGIETMLDAVCFDTLLDSATLVITGEGRIDTQSLSGKVVVGVARRAMRKGVPVVALVGDIGDDIEAIYDEGVLAILSINRVAVSLSKARKRSGQDLALTMDTLMRLMALAR